MLYNDHGILYKMWCCIMSMECVSGSVSALIEHRWIKSTTKPARPCMKYVECKMLATKYPPKNDGAAAAVEASAPPPRTPDRPAAAADEPRPKCGMALSDDEGQADKQLLNKRALEAGRSVPGKGNMEGGVLGT
jgi:hypothetical protein